MVSNVVYDKKGNMITKVNAVNALEAVQSGQYTWNPPGELKVQSDEIKEEVKIQTMSKIPLIEHAKKVYGLILDPNKEKGVLVGEVLAVIARKSMPASAPEVEEKLKPEAEEKPKVEKKETLKKLKGKSLKSK